MVYLDSIIALALPMLGWWVAGLWIEYKEYKREKEKYTCMYGLPF